MLHTIDSISLFGLSQFRLRLLNTISGLTSNSYRPQLSTCPHNKLVNFETISSNSSNTLMVDDAP